MTLGILRVTLRFMSSPPPDPVPVPHTDLSADALRGVIESFVLREGTDYGAREYSLDEKVAHVMRQLERGEARILFYPATSTVDVVVADRGREE